ncbi:hypothetical protein DIE21_35270 [Burkholderia sp. Bp9140]|nr:hypothetical protein DIE21_35270 [Burkholderia sp. Bp9140]
MPRAAGGVRVDGAPERFVAVNGTRGDRPAHRSPLTAHRSPLTAHRSPLTAHRSPHRSRTRKRRPRAPSICCGLSDKLIRTCDGCRRAPQPGCWWSTGRDR